MLFYLPTQIAILSLAMAVQTPALQAQTFQTQTLTTAAAPVRSGAAAGVRPSNAPVLLAYADTAPAPGGIRPQATGLTITNTSIPSAFINQPYTPQVFQATGGSGSYTWSVANAPPGLTMSTGGVFSGTPTSAGTFSNVVVTVNDPSILQTAQQTYSMTVRYLPLSISTASLPAGAVGVAYTTTTLAATGGSGSVTWSATGLPSGLALSPAGVLSGNPTAGGPFTVTVTATDATASLTANQTYALNIAYAPLAITSPANLGSFPPNKAFSVTLTATGGKTPYTWSGGIALPFGLTLNASTGVLSGTPSQVGNITFTATVFDAQSPAASVAQVETISVTNGVSIVSVALAPATVNQPYQFVFAGSGGNAGAYQWTLATGSVLPKGLTLATTGLLSGTPTVAGNYTFAIQLTDGASTAQQTISLQVAPGGTQPLTITTTALSAGTVGVAYPATTLSASGGSGTVAWTASGLPNGLTLSTAGVLSGTPTVGGLFPVNITATDTIAAQTASQLFPLNIAYPALTITSAANLGTFPPNKAFSVTLAATGGLAPYTWSATSQLPPGLTLNPATGVLSGTLNQNGSYSLSLRVTDSQSPAASASLAATLVVGNGLTITSSPTLPSATKNQPYQFTFTASGGTTTTYQWSIVSGNPPVGLSLNASSGVFAGTPAATGSFSFVVQATDGTSPGQQNVTLQVVDVLTITTGSLPAGAVGQPYGPVVLSAAGGTGNYVWSATGIPAGLALSSSGALSGLPSVAGVSSNVVITVTDTGTNLKASATFSLTITGQNSTLTLSGGPIPNFASGGSVTGTYTASGGVPPYSYSLQNAPAGVSIGPSTGVLSGAVTTPGNYNMTVAATDAQPVTTSVVASFSVLGITTTSLPAGTTAADYSGSISALGGTPPYTFSATGLPAGLVLSATGTFSGRATSVGTSTVQVKVTDRQSLSSTATFTLVIAAPSPLTAGSVTLASGTVGQPYSQTLAATGGAPPYTWAQVGGGLPDGLSLIGSGTVSGIPTAPGTYQFTAVVTDTAGATARATFTLTIAPLPLVLTTNGAFPAGLAGQEYNPQVLGATGGVAPYTFKLASGTLPAGITLSSGTLAGTPTTAGTSTFSLSVTDSASPAATATAQAQIVVKAATATDILLSSGSAAFAITTGTSEVPPSTQIAVRSSQASQVLNFTAAVDPGAPWLKVSSGNKTPAIVTIGLADAALALTTGASPYAGSVTVTCVAPSPCAGSTQKIAVTLAVTAPPAQLSVGTSLLSFAISPANPGGTPQALILQNIGGGSLGVASITAADPWVVIGSFPSSIKAGPAVSVPITVSTIGLTSGFYRSTITIVTSSGRATVPVTLFYTANSSMTLNPAGAQLTMQAGGAVGNPKGSFLISLSANTSVAWTAAVASNSPWLVLNSISGSATDTVPGNVSYSIDPVASAALSPGAYYGTIRVSADGIVNSPQDYQVILTVSPATVSVVPDPQPGGLLFISSATGATPPQIVNVYASSKTPLTYQASASTNDGGSWLQVSPTTGTTSSGSPAQSSITISRAGLNAGVYRGGVSYSFAGSSAVRTVSVTLIVQAAASPQATPLATSLSTQSRPAPEATCSATQLVPAPTVLTGNFAAPASWPTPIAVKLVNDCGNSVTNGQIVTSFSNGDPPLILTLADPANAIYSGTWTPRRTGSQVNVTAKATAPNLPAASVQISGQVTPNAVPSLAAHGTLHIFNPQIGGAVGPGNIVQIYGSYLASDSVIPPTLPLPVEALGTSVLIGGIQAPLYYVGPNQINAEIPFELTAGKTYQVIVNANGALTTPDSIALTPVAPGIAQFATGQIIAQHIVPSYSLISDSSPAQPGEYIEFYVSGFGLTDVPVASGAGSPGAVPGSSLARPVTPPVLTINGAPVDIYFAGLTPTQVALYQVDVQLPLNLPDGTATIVLRQGSTVSNSVSLPVHK